MRYINKFRKMSKCNEISPPNYKIPVYKNSYYGLRFELTIWKKL